MKCWNLNKPELYLLIRFAFQEKKIFAVKNTWAQWQLFQLLVCFFKSITNRCCKDVESNWLIDWCLMLYRQYFSIITESIWYSFQMFWVISYNESYFLLVVTVLEPKCIYMHMKYYIRDCFCTWISRQCSIHLTSPISQIKLRELCRVFPYL